jgi:putative heme-binding domain-containing protein
MNTSQTRIAGLGMAYCVAGLLTLSALADGNAGDVTADDYVTLPGFKLEIVLKADPKVHGSWISLGKDDRGRLLMGAERNEPLTRVTLDERGQVAKQEVIKLPVSEVMGQACVNGSLYLDGFGKTPGSGKPAFGIWRLRDPKGDGSFESVELLREWKGGAGGHGAHAIRVGPDGKHLWVVCGNFVAVPDDLAATSPHRNYADDLVLPRAEDGNGFGAGRKPPGGFIAKMDLEGKNVELYHAGERNVYDIAFNADGEILGFDSDMEWDWGMAWYRPVRVFHATSGGDGGFREGTGKWPTYYPDSLPPVTEIGIGCPTGVLFGTGAKFPAKYQKAFYISDWTYGRLIAVHLTPRGASYEASGWENLVRPKGMFGIGEKVPLNLTGLAMGNDGALYFVVGGWHIQSRLFRLSYVGGESTAAVDLHDAASAEDRALRHRIEAFHGRTDPRAIDFVWPSLGSPDRYIRYAARIAVEAQPLEQWKAKALAEARPAAALTALLALARVGGTQCQADLLSALSRVPLASLDEEGQLNKLRVIEVSLSRQGKPTGDLAAALVAELGPLYPAKSVELNRELCQLLLALEAPDAVAKTVKLLQAAPTQEEQTGYVLALRTIQHGWTPELRRAYLSWWSVDRRAVNLAQHPPRVLKWFEEAGRPYGNGSSFNNFVTHLHDDAVQSVPEGERASLADVINAFKPLPRPAKPVKPRALVKEWTMPDLEPLLGRVSHGRKFAAGKAAFEEAQCLSCHKFGNEGGAVGPDLTAVSSRFQRRDVLESILEPSKVIAEQFLNTEVRTKDGDVEVGRLIEETDDAVVLQPSPLTPETVKISTAQIRVRRFSKVSPMPEGLLNGFTKEEILDLLAYLESGGRADHADFAAAAAAAAGK